MEQLKGIGLGVILAVAAVLIFGLAYRRLRRGTDIIWPVLPSNLQWVDPAAAEESLGKIHEYAMSFCNSSIAWYQGRRQPKRTAGFLLRAGALLATVGAGLVPLTEDLGFGRLPPVLSTLLIAVAGLFVSIDHLGGFTSGWVRYMLAQQKIERLRDAFLIDWNGLRAGAAVTPTFLERTRAFLSIVGKVLDDETQEWATEFQNALKDLERARKTESETPRTGAIEISIKNPQLVAGWTLEIDGSQRGRSTGKTLAVADVLVGLHKARAYGSDDQGRVFSDERIIKVEGGTTVSRELELC
jgi:hypothetical protein